MAQDEENPAEINNTKPQYQSAEQMFKRVRNGENISLEDFGRNAAGYNYQRAENSDGTVNEAKLIANTYKHMSRASEELPPDQRAGFESDLKKIKPTREQLREAKQDGGGVTTAELLDGTDGEKVNHAKTFEPLDKNKNTFIDRCDLGPPKPNDKKDMALFAKLCGDAGVNRESYNPQPYGAESDPKGNQVSGEGVVRPSREQGAAPAH